MYETQAALVTLLPLLLFKLFQVVGDVTVNCTVEVQVPRNCQYQSKPGDSLSIECPVKYCTEKPAIKWCLIQGMRCLLLKDGPTRCSVWREGNVAVLNFMSIHQSNSGLYRCRAVVGSLSHESHAIRVIVRETTDFIPMSREPQVLPGNLADNVVVSSVTGYRAVLSCSNMSLVNLISAVWKIRLRDGACCLLAYRADLNKTVRTNCSERMDWAARPDHDPTLQIHPVRLSDEGYYMCEIANIDGSLHQNYTLSVLVPPEVTLTLDISGTPLCKASAGKPAAQISWLPAGDHNTEHGIHTNGTVTVLSTYRVNNLSKKKSICFVSHLTGNKSQSIKLPSEHEGFSLLLHYLLTGSTISCVIIVTILYCTLQHRGCFQGSLFHCNFPTVSTPEDVSGSISNDIPPSTSAWTSPHKRSTSWTLQC
ncbi:cell surface glycoprotein CD200 receptor 1-A-like [Chelonia mydas]|uniref:cell surface glycoprotein CD200 receptor 1-A-like n=1 Tax=Chelonia mydas TaxID=8469 RepID=UPI001CA95B96|nr:cell surface glycoprotein CD200 receptor 1-A-like [Chelonia mydas]